jgi:hypothetical protein
MGLAVFSGFIKTQGKVDVVSLGVYGKKTVSVIECYYRKRAVIMRLAITDICPDYCDQLHLCDQNGRRLGNLLIAAVFLSALSHTWLNFCACRDVKLNG